jgi:GGDEF domain-containing protein
VSPFVESARRALLALPGAPDDLLASVVLRARGVLDADADPRPLLTFWSSREIGSITGSMRYRWDLSHRRCPTPPYAGRETAWRTWRPAEQTLVEKDPFAFEERLTIPILVAETCDLLASLADAGDATAAQLFHEADPVFRRDLASAVQAQHTWTDTFALYCLVRRPRALARMHPLAIAIASTYAGAAERADGVALGTRFPFHEVPLASATAQLAAGLVALGMELELVSKLVARVRAWQRPSGAWGDGDGPDDPMTTLVAADLLAHLDPSLDCDVVLAAVARMQSDDGLFRALGPDAPWLTLGLVELARACERTFAQRFRWPHLPHANKDRKTGLPFFAYFVDLATLFSDLPGLAAATTDAAFVDLAGFGAFNNKYGQDLGDAVLRAFAEEIDQLEAARVIRDGGDEFLIVGAPERTGLARDLDAFRKRWPARFRARFGDDAPPVAPRILVGRTKCGALRGAREDLGREIGGLKLEAAKPGPEGILDERA